MWVPQPTRLLQSELGKAFKESRLACVCVCVCVCVCACVCAKPLPQHIAEQNFVLEPVHRGGWSNSYSTWCTARQKCCRWNWFVHLLVQFNMFVLTCLLALHQTFGPPGLFTILHVTGKLLSKGSEFKEIWQVRSGDHQQLIGQLTIHHITLAPWVILCTSIKGGWIWGRWACAPNGVQVPVYWLRR